MEAWSSWSKDNSFSLYADGFPTESRPATPTGDDAASNQNGGKDDDDDSSAFMASAPSVLLSGASSAVLFSLRSPRLALFATTLTAFAYFSK